VETSLAPYTTAARGVGLWLAATVAFVAVLTAAGVMQPAFPNEAEVTAATFLLGAFLAGLAVWQREPATPALAWALVDALLAAGVLLFAKPIGLA